MTVAVFDSSVLPEPPPPRRAGEIVWGTTTIRFDTEHIGGLPISTGEPIGYVFSRDGREIGGVDLGDGVTPPSVFIPGKGDLNRDPTMIAALALLYFQDPGRS